MEGYRRMHHYEIDGAAWDLAPRDAPPERRVVICSTPRSGSYLMCRQMINAGIGLPHEYFRARTIHRLAPRYGVPVADVAGYVDALEARRTTANGVFAAKLQWTHLASYPALRERLLERADLVVFLYRRDVLAQAVSWQVSLATGYWSFDTTVGLRAPDVTLDFSALTLQLADEIAVYNRSWEAMLAGLAGRRVLPVPYESYVRDQPALMRHLATGLALPSGAWTLPSAEGRDSRLPDEVEAARERLLARARAAHAAARP